MRDEIALDWVIVATFPDRLEADLALGLLQSAGLTARLGGSIDAAGLVVRVGPLSEASLLVLAEEAAVARELLAARPEAGPDQASP